MIEVESVWLGWAETVGVRNVRDRSEVEVSPILVREVEDSFRAWACSVVL